MFADLGIDAAPADDADRRALRAVVIEALGEAANDPKISAAARAALTRSMEGGAPLDATAADAIVRVAAQQGDTALWERLSAASRQATSPSDRYRYLYALSAFQNPALIDRGLNFSLTADLRSQDTPGYLTRFLGNASARVRTWTFIKEHWAALEPKITISLGDVRLVQGLGVFCDASARDDIRAFFSTHKLPAASRALDQTIERINNCVAIKERQSAPLSTWLAARGI
jgi:aminopeptidase N/puromycin-sensitive aminopeptidase